MPDLPSGTVTFLFTDIEGSTALWERDRQAMATAVERHLALLRVVIERHGGTLFKVVGDAVQAAFPVAGDALGAAVAAQRALQNEPGPELPGPLHVRIALHTGEAHPRDGDYRASPLNRLARLLAAGHGGQILLTQAVQQLVRDDLPTSVILSDLGIHRLRDLQEPEAVFQVVAPGLGETFPPLRTLPSHPTNLTEPATSLIGREDELAGVLRLFDEGARLVTLTGPGGTGKTRLALEIAAEALGWYPDGVFFVDLAPVRDARHVVPAIASVLGVRENPGEPWLETLVRALGERRMLLVLDNCEQVLEAAPDIAALLGRCPDLVVIATSREPLRVRAERTFPVSSLALPASQRVHALAVLVHAPSVALFVERAQAADPTFAVTEENGPAIAEICRRLDGLPLAIELAAARVRLLPPEALLLRLERSLPLLTSGARDAPARQRTLRDTIAWSYDLLSPEEQALFRRLSAFVGGWTVGAAEAVLSPAGETDVLGELGSLVERSLVQPGKSSAQEPRFAMLETIREYGVEQLVAGGEEEQTRERHAAWVLELAGRVETQMFRADQQTWRERLEAERPNIRAALAWFERIGDAERAQRLSGQLAAFGWLSGHLQEGQEWLQRALTIPGATSPATRAWALIGSGTLSWFRGDNDAARVLLEQSLAVSRDGRFALGVARSLQSLAMVAWTQGNLEQAVDLGEEAIERLRELGHLDLLATALADVGTVALMKGDARGKAWSQEGLTLSRALGNRWFTANHLSDLGAVAHGQGDLVQAARHYLESTCLFREVGDTWYIASPLAGLAAIAVAHGQAEPAARLLGVAAALREVSGSQVWPWEEGRDAQAMAAARAALGEEGYAQALHAGRTMRIEQAVDEAIAIADSLSSASAATQG